MEKGKPIIEPEKYLVEFGRESTTSYKIWLAIGIIVSLFCVFLSFPIILQMQEHPFPKNMDGIFEFILLLLLGLSFISGSLGALKKVKNQPPQIKMAKEGIWTKKIGFVPWDKFKRYHFTESIIDNKLLTRITGEEGSRMIVYLHIFLSNNDTNQPDDVVILGDAEDRRIYEYTLYEMQSKD